MDGMYSAHCKQKRHHWKNKKSFFPTKNRAKSPKANGMWKTRHDSLSQWHTGRKTSVTENCSKHNGNKTRVKVWWQQQPITNNQQRWLLTYLLYLQTFHSSTAPVTKNYGTVATAWIFVCVYWCIATNAWINSEKSCLKTLEKMVACQIPETETTDDDNDYEKQHWKRTALKQSDNLWNRQEKIIITINRLSNRPPSHPWKTNHTKMAMFWF